ncbi:hypothetical protein ABPG73_018485 [Tetrahymena malaccensis]
MKIQVSQYNTTTKQIKILLQRLNTQIRKNKCSRKENSLIDKNKFQDNLNLQQNQNLNKQDLQELGITESVFIPSIKTNTTKMVLSQFSKLVDCMQDEVKELNTQIQENVFTQSQKIEKQSIENPPHSSHSLLTEQQKIFDPTIKKYFQTDEKQDPFIEIQKSKESTQLAQENTFDQFKIKTEENIFKNNNIDQMNQEIVAKVQVKLIGFLGLQKKQIQFIIEQYADDIIDFSKILEESNNDNFEQ